MQAGPGVTINSQISGSQEKGVFSELNFALEQGKTNVKSTFAGKKLTVDRGDGKPSTLDSDPKEVFWANLHPQIGKDMFTGVESPNTKVNIHLVDSWTPVEVKITPKPSLTRQVKGKAIAVRVYHVDFPGVGLDYFLDDEGDVLAMDVPAQKIRYVAEGAEKVFEDPLSKYPNLSQATHKVETLEWKMKTRDGVELVSTVVKPKEAGKYPAILSRTPYGRAMVAFGAEFWAQRGYVFVAQDVRGSGGSGGEWDPFIFEAKDGYDAVEAIAKADWSNGKVGMIGASYGGYVQWAAASLKPPALKAIIPQVSPPSSAMENLPYDQGVFTLFQNLWWLKIVADPKQSNMAAATQGVTKPEALKKLPISKIDDELFGKNYPLFDKWVKRETAKDWIGWNFGAATAQVTIPVFHISGYFDGDQIGTQLHWRALAKKGHGRQWMIYGPWTHAFNTTRSLMGEDFGPDAILELDSEYLRFFDTYLKDKSVGQADKPRSRFFVMGENRWRESKVWPPVGKPATFFGQIQQGSKHRHRLGSAATAGSLTVKYDPSKATVPKELTGTLDIQSQKKIEFKDLIKQDPYFVSEPFASDRVFAGAAQLEFQVTSNAQDTDFFAELIEIRPDGSVWPLGQGAKYRASYRLGFDKRVAITPGKPFTVRMKFWDVAHRIKKGSKLALTLTSNSFPMSNRNLGTIEPASTATKWVVQNNVIKSSKASPIRLTLNEISTKP
jgi:putative CocE/NonD family hydrolase